MILRPQAVWSCLAAAAALTFATSCGGSGDTPASPGSPSGAPPNIVLILADDLALMEMPYLAQVKAQIASRGMTFNNAFVTNSLCCPSRATILTGQYAHNHGVLTNDPPKGGWDAFFNSGKEKDTLAVWLRRGGYLPALIGKYLNRYPSDGSPTFIPQGWEEWQAIFSDRGSDAYYNYSVSANGTIESYGRRDEDYITDVILRKSLDFLRRTEANDAQPFFLHITPNAPHRPAEPAARHAGLMPGLKTPHTPNWNEADVSDKPGWLRNAFTPFTAQNEADIDQLFRDRVLSMQAVDELVGSVVQELTRLGEIDNTYIIFTSDNGFLMGPHRFGRGKDAPYEESIRIPLIVRGPGIAAGSTSDAFVLNNDFAPTVIDLAQQPVPATVDGRSFNAILHGNKPSDWRTDFLIEHWATETVTSENDGNGVIPDYVGVRTDRYSYIEYITGETELYDLREDPYQLASLHRTAANATLIPLQDRLKVLKTCRGATCR
jgi:N-acetylglucosamine-6-sulfatase